MKITKELLLKHTDLTVRELSKVLDIPVCTAYNKVKQYGVFDLFKSPGVAHLPKKIHLIDKKGNVKIFESMWSASKFLGIKKGRITYHLDRGTWLLGYRIITDPEIKKIQKLRRISEKTALRKIKERKINQWNEEIEMVFRKMGYYKS